MARQVEPLILRSARTQAWPELSDGVDAQAMALQFQFDRIERWDAARLRAHQLAQAQRLIAHAARTVPFHGARLARFAALRPGQLTYERFLEVPIMQRTDIQAAGPALITRALPKAHAPMHRVRSSGSTGRPIEVRGTRLTALMVRAFSFRGHRWHRRDFEAKNVDIRTAHAPGRTPRASTWLPVPGSGPSVLIDIALPISAIFERVLEEQPDYLQTHPYTLLGLVERSQALGVRPARLREARTFGEALEPEVRRLVEDAWGVPVVDNYSAMECGTIAHQCPESANLHVMAEGVLVEVLDERGAPCRAGETGRVTVTALHNFATPLIRYEIGDYATLGGPCACGRALPVLTRIRGRERNLLVYPNGDKRFVETRMGGMEDIAPYRQWQVIQRTLHDIELRLVMPRPLTPEEAARFKRHIVERYGYPFNVSIVLADDIPRMANGKFEEFHSEVAGATIAADPAAGTAR